MTYGVDQCRRCGKPIEPTSPDDLRRYQQSLVHKPTMTEAEWRQAGLKAMPTRYQMNRPLTGMCSECRLLLAHRKSRGSTMLFWLGLIAAMMFGVIAFILLHSQ